MLPLAGAKNGLLLMFAHVLHGSATLFLFEAIQVNVSVKVIAFMLKHTTHNASALEHDFLAVQINATHTGILGLRVLYHSPGTDKHPSSPYCSPDFSSSTGFST